MCIHGFSKVIIHWFSLFLHYVIHGWMDLSCNGVAAHEALISRLLFASSVDSLSLHSGIFRCNFNLNIAICALYSFKYGGR